MNKKAFSIIEVMVSTIILTIAVFGVYKLIGENSKIIGNNNNYLQSKYIINNTIECLDKIGLLTFTGSTQTSYNFNFGTDYKQCNTGSTIPVIINNLEYEVTGNITGSGAGYINWDISVEGEALKKMTRSFLQIKK